MPKASFRFSPYILARLGEELNQSAEQSIAELVKNSYDADAKTCKIHLLSVGQPGGTIVISDDGDGMDPTSIRDNWLVLGSSGKVAAGTTRLGRHQAGSKGLGRLAALRMGSKVVLRTVRRNLLDRAHQLTIDWSLFDNAKVVEDVSLEIVTKKSLTRKCGTRTELVGLRSALGSDELRKLARALLLLTDPFGDKGRGFQVELVAPEFKEIEALIAKKYFDDASYHLAAELKADGTAAVRVLDWQGQELTSADLGVSKTCKTPKLYKAPPAVFDLWIFILDSDAEAFSSRIGGKTEIRTWLATFGGVHVYQDGIRVAPYGNPGNDWLEMNLTRARNPEERPSTNTSIGRVQIAGVGAHALRQKTDRMGFIEDETFNELRMFAQDSLSWLARWRLGIAEKRRAKNRAQAADVSSAQKEKVANAISLAPENVRRVIEDAFAGYAKTRDKEADTLRKEVQLYRTLSTAGITAATFSHESQGNSLKRIELGVAALKTRIPKYSSGAAKDKLLSPLQDIERAAAGIAVLGTATLSIIKATKRRVGKVKVHDVIGTVAALLDPFVSDRTTTLSLDLCDGNPYLRTSEAALESILANLINNSLAAFVRAGSVDRRIAISTFVRGEYVELSVSDSGPGVRDIDHKDIWLPGVTGNPEGTGLGLTIVRDTVTDMGGEVRLVTPSRLGGAEFLVRLPILGS
ncbi:MAG: ATP-binding protein [Rhodocyclales bacterium]|nr:ATP-binding protein [Rhodocyclales bacterium]